MRQTEAASVDRINGLNVVLMLLSAGLAAAYPFQLFLFAYAVLGPLHYLTEISWLHDRGYYLKGRGGAWFLAAAAALYTGIKLVAPRTPAWMTGSVTAVAFLAALSFVLFAEDSV